MNAILPALALGLTLLLGQFAHAQADRPAELESGGSGPAKVLLLTGQNNHDWPRTSAMLRGILDETGLFEIDSWEGPGAKTREDTIDTPVFADYDLVVWDYNPGGGYQWPDPLREAWTGYIEGGGRALLVHASNNPFPGWDDFERMVGLLWRDADGGSSLQFDSDGAPVRTPAGEGGGAGHGAKHDFQVRHREPDHPILAGLPELWLHAHDELYHRQRGPAPDDMLVLATAWDDPEHGGTGMHEPVLWQIPFGDGLVMTWLPGHLWRGQDDTRAFRSVGFRTIVQRAAEWLATGRVTQQVPDDFPSADEVSLVEERAIEPRGTP